jgi:TonB family protein
MKGNQSLFHSIGICLVVFVWFQSSQLWAQVSSNTVLFEEPCESFNQAEFDIPPAMIDLVTVEYPEIAFRAELAGSVTLKAAINPNGSICSILVSEPLNPILNNAAIEALKESKFQPARKNDQPTQGVVFVTYKFVYEKEYIRREAQARNEIRIKTKEELQTMLNRSETEIPESFAYTFSLLGKGNTDFLIGLLQHESYRIRRYAAQGLGRIGSTIAIDALIQQISDLHEGSRDWPYLVDALVYAGDKAALPVLYELEQKLRAENRVFGDGVLFSIRQIEDRDIGRPLLMFSRGNLRFRFRLDEICRVYFLQEPETYVSNGYIYSPDPYSTGKRTAFKQGDFRKICDLLSDGYSQKTLMSRGAGEYLVIELCDGNHVALTRNGEDFTITGEHRDGSGNLFSITSHDLADFIDQTVESHGDS